MSAIEVLDAIVAIRMNGQYALLSEALAALMAYNVGAIVSIEMTLIIGRVIASIASVILPSINPRPLTFLIAFEDLFAVYIKEHGKRIDGDTL